MAENRMKTEEFYPFVKQILSDTFKVTAFLMQPPYRDFEEMDMGLRRMVWGEYATSKPIFSLGQAADYEIVVIESSLGFYNVLAVLKGEGEPDLIGILPFRSEPIERSIIQQIMKDNGIDPTHTTMLTKFYMGLPVVSIDDLILTMGHLISHFVPEFCDYRSHTISYSSTRHRVSPSEERFTKFSADYYLELNKRLEACSKAVCSGNQAAAVEHIKSVLDYATILETGPTSETKRNLTGLNNFFVSRMLETAVHPSYILEQAQNFELRIDECRSANELRRLPFDMARKYAILSKNYTYEGYSYLIRSVVNYIDQHLAMELTLSSLAETFDKNASYLSNAFKKEVGETLTTYINKQRIQASLRYFNTTNLSVAEVAELVGVSDFGYFSKLFKKYVGFSPREYKKMLDK